MARASKYHGSLNAKDFNLLMFFNFFVAFAGSLFLAWQTVQAGVIYALMFVGMMSSVALIHLFLSDDRSWKPISNYAKVPITTSMKLAAISYIGGMILPFLLNMVFRVFDFSVTSFAVPLFGSEIAGGQTFATAAIGESMAWKVFNIMFVAGNMETLVYNFGLMMIGILIGIMVLRLINDEKDLSFMSKRTFVLMFGFATTVVLFVISHVFNGSYGLTEFIVAGIFLLIANISIYYAGFLLTFWAGYHQSNNLIFLIQQEGLSQVLKGFVSPFGLIFVIYIALIVYYILRKSPQVKKEVGRYVRS